MIFFILYFPFRASSNQITNQMTPKSKQKLASEHVLKAQEYASNGNKHGALLHYKKGMFSIYLYTCF